MTTLAYTVPTAGTDLNSVADPEIASALNTIKTWANGNLDAVNLSALLAQAAGVNQNTQVVKGVSNIATSESRTNVAFGTMPTPDQVTGIVLPTNGLLAVSYQALWQNSVAGAGQAAIFVGANQLQIQGWDSVTGHQPLPEAACGVPAGLNQPLFSFFAGLGSGTSSTAFTGDATTGQVVGYANVNGGNVGIQIGAGGINDFSFTNSGPGASAGIVGGPCYIFAAAGTYTVSVQFKSSSGSVTASGRKLWVQALSFS